MHLNVNLLLIQFKISAGTRTRDDSSTERSKVCSIVVLRLPLPIELQSKNIIFGYTATITCGRKVLLVLLPKLQGISTPGPLSNWDFPTTYLAAKSSSSLGVEIPEGKGGDGNMERSTSELTWQRWGTFQLGMFKFSSC